MNLKNWILPLLTLVAIFVFFLRKEKSEPSEESSTSEIDSRVEILNFAEIQKKVGTEKTNSASSSRTGEKTQPPLNPQTEANEHIAAVNSHMFENLKRSPLPVIQSYQADLKEDPHGSPAILGSFAQSLVPHVERALTVESYSPLAFDYLETCARTELPFAARSHCLKQARRIAQIYPGKFEARLKNLEAALPPRVLELIR